MASPRFDPTHAVKFDLARGVVDAGGARLLVPADALLSLCRAAGEESQRDFGRRLGTEAGWRMLESLGGDGGKASLPAVVEHLGGQLALFGLGSVSLERWGRAMVLAVDGSPLGAAGDALIAAIFEGVLQRGFGRDASVVVLTREDHRVRFLVVSPAGADKARAWLTAGSTASEVIARLHEGRGDA